MGMVERPVGFFGEEPMAFLFVVAFPEVSCY